METRVFFFFFFFTPKLWIDKQIEKHNVQYNKYGPKIKGCVKTFSFSNYLEITTAVVVPFGGPKISPLHRYSADIFTFSGPLGL